MPRRMSAVCPACDRPVRICVPRGGDGSADVYVRHLANDGVTRCSESRNEVKREAYEPWLRGSSAP